jgi:two-component system chemotaxis response regulator CheY
MSLKALVADDSGTMRKIIIRALNVAGIEDVVEASDGAQAVKLFEPGSFDVVLTDWNMPEKSGLAVVSEIRAMDPDVRIIMVTTEAERSRVLQAIQEGASDYLIKPFTSEALREKLAKHVCA